MKSFIIVLAALLIGFQSARAQCSGPIVSGHAIKGEMLQGCAPFPLEILNLYSNSTADAVFTVDWGDGTVETYLGSSDPVDGGFIDPKFTPDFTHTYVANASDCGYDIVIEASNGCTLPSDARIELSVSVWDTDWRGIDINPGMVRVCQGYAADITFTDMSNWNCFPRNDRQNNPPRWVRWIYQGGTINGINIPGLGGAPVSGPLKGVMNVGDQSRGIHIPALDPANPGNPYAVGSFFSVTLQNWNQCNPPGNTPVSTNARIVIVDTPVPDFVTKKEGPSSPIQTDFCVDDIVYFDNETSVIDTDAAMNYTWEFYDGPDDSHPLLATKKARNPVFIYVTGGVKFIRLIAGDNNTVGNCSAIVEKVVHVYPTSIAQIDASETKFCKDTGSDSTFTVVFEDVSIGSNGNTRWMWEFFDEHDNLIRTEGWSNVQLGPFTMDYTNPGVYKTRLYTKDSLTDCYTRDEVSVVVYTNPLADFDYLNICEGDSLRLVDQSSLNVINNNKIIIWEWDFDYDGVAFNPDETYVDDIPDTLSYFLPPGPLDIALRVTNDQNGCFMTEVHTAEVYANPLAIYDANNMEGCSPLNVEFTNTSIASEIVNIDQYIWCVDYGNGYIDTIYTDDTQVDLTAVFVNEDTQPQNFGVKLRSISEHGCMSISEPDTVRVFPSIQAGFNHLNYDPFDKNCAPFPVLFQVGDPTMALMPDSYTWQVRKDSVVIHSVTNTPDNPQFEFDFTAEGVGINCYSVSLYAQMDEACLSDSTLKINANPLPTAAFTIDTLRIDCEEMELEVSAVQGTLMDYDWVIFEGMDVNMNDSLDESFIYRVTRPPSTSLNLDLRFQLRTTNFAMCQSELSTTDIIVNRQPLLQAHFSPYPEYMVYPSTTVEVTNNSVSQHGQFTWDFGDDNLTSERDPAPHTYELSGDYTIKLSIEEDYCFSYDSAKIHIEPRPPEADFSFDPQFGCAPLTVHFTNLSQNTRIDKSNFVWQFGDNQAISNAINPNYTYYEPGIYSVKLEVTNQDGLSDAVLKTQIIEVYPRPMVSFDIRPTTVSIPDDPIYITNFSRGAIDYYWDFGDGGTSFEFEPSYAYSDTGSYDITLIGISSRGCQDTMKLANVVQVVNAQKVNIPNAFTPSLEGPSNGSIYAEGRNDVFYPITEGVIQYKMQIFNRWGELIFETGDRNHGWDGYYNGRICPQDVYIYKIDFRYLDGVEESKFGDVTLIR